MRLPKRVTLFLLALGFFAGSLFAQQKFTTQLIPRKAPCALVAGFLEN
jgi:hypothetical protein